MQFREIDRALLAALPDSSGVYEYYDSEQNILYVGKAKNLKKRVKSYFASTLAPNPRNSLRIQNMISKVKFIAITTTFSEQDALILENNRIKLLRPKYNVLLRDDKTYPYICINMDTKYPTLAITREKKRGNIRYFGPYTTSAKEMVEAIKILVPLVQRKITCLKEKRPCLFYQINRCKAPCVGLISEGDYEILLKEAIKYLNNPNNLANKIKEKMALCSEAMRYEEAGQYRDIYQKLSLIAKSNIDLKTNKNYDAFAMEIDINSNSAVFCAVFVRDGKVISKNDDYLNLRNQSPYSAYAGRILNYYERHSMVLPDEVIIEENEESAALKEALLGILGANVKIVVPQKGEKDKIKELAKINARSTLEHMINRGQKHKETIEALKLLLGVEEINRIEVFDTSHHSGQANVGAMVVYEDSHLAKSEYRHYHLLGSDEYAQMREMLIRRAKKFDECKPDLWVLDGGIAQLNLANEIIKSSGYEVAAMAISKQKQDKRSIRAKGGALDILYFGENIYRLKAEDKILQFVQMLRDEVHRFAISFHRQTKQKEMLISAFMRDNNLSEAKIKRLIQYFGSFEELNKASKEAIKQVLKEKF